MTEYYLNEKNFVDTDYKFEKIHDQLYLIENFITEEERVTILNFAKNRTQQEWEFIYINNLKDQMKAEFNTDDLDKLQAEGKLILNMEWYDRCFVTRNYFPEIEKRWTEEVHKLFKGQNLSIRSFSTIQRHQPGNSMKEHIDNDHNENLIFAGVTYLNDDYNGGELYFRKLNITLKPPARSLALFSTTGEFIHGIKEVLDGPTRYAMPCFLWKEDPNPTWY